MDARVGAILDLHRRGAKVLMRRAVSGKGHVKVLHGPFGLRTTRFELDEAAFEELKAAILHGPGEGG